MFVFISFGPIGDYGSWRKRLLRLTSIIGSLLTASSALLMDPSLYWVAGLLIVTSNTFFGLSIVYYQTYLPLLVSPPHSPFRRQFLPDVFDPLDLHVLTGAFESFRLILHLMS